MAHPLGFSPIQVWKSPSGEIQIEAGCFGSRSRDFWFEITKAAGLSSCSEYVMSLEEKIV